jgi:NDP-sugar pyrophosphorylase family protein
MEAAILCGGEGTRLRPLTYAVPKPLLPLGSKPILEVMINRMKEQGFRKFHLMVNYKSEMIRSYFGSGTNYDVEIEYYHEKTKRGTAGPLVDLLEKIDTDFVVLNADLLTSISFVDLVNYHNSVKSEITVALKKFERNIAYGVADVGPESRIIQIREKPEVRFLINTGIYVLSKKILELIPNNKEYQMTELISDAILNKRTVFGYEFSDAWRDIGRMDDYMKVIGDLENGRESDLDGFFS